MTEGKDSPVEQKVLRTSPRACTSQVCPQQVVAAPSGYPGTEPISRLGKFGPHEDLCAKDGKFLRRKASGNRILRIKLPPYKNKDNVGDVQDAVGRKRTRRRRGAMGAENLKLPNVIRLVLSATSLGRDLCHVPESYNPMWWRRHGYGAPLLVYCLGRSVVTEEESLDSRVHPSPHGLSVADAENIPHTRCWLSQMWLVESQTDGFLDPGSWNCWGPFNVGTRYAGVICA